MITVLYITYIDFGNFSSGSFVRPQMMEKAFEDAGYKVKLLNGSQETANKEQRRKNVEEINNWLDCSRPDFCYIESPTYPILHSFDIKLIRRIHNMGISSGYFFRDAYYKLGKEFYGKQKQTPVRRLKNTYLRMLYARNEKLLFNNIDIVYFPTMTMASYFSYHDMRALPPAGNLISSSEKIKKGFTSIYVGGLSASYGADIMLKAFSLLNNHSDKEYSLILVCRESEMNNLKTEYSNSAWLSIYHASGEKQLAALYAQADCALLPRSNSPYNDLSFSVKVFEYMEHGLPIVACGSKEMAAMIEKYQMGVVTGFTPEEFAAAIRKLLDSETNYFQYASNAKEALLKENLWLHRAQTIRDDLLKVKKK